MSIEQPDSERPLVLDIQSGACRYGLEWLANGVDWLPGGRIGNLIVTDFGDIHDFDEKNKRYCKENFDVEADEVLRRLIRLWVDYYWEFPIFEYNAISWCFRSTGLSRSSVDFRKIGEMILKHLKPDGIFFTRILCERILERESLPRAGQREGRWLKYLFGDDWEKKFKVQNCRKMTREDLKLHAFQKYPELPVAAEIILRKCA